MSRRILRPCRPALIASILLGVAAQAGAQDLSVVTVLAPGSGCALGHDENVVIRLFNYGMPLPAGTTFSVAYAINAGTPVFESVVLGTSLLTDSTFTYTFTTQANLAIPGTYDFDATVSLAGDINPGNDAFHGHAVTNSAPSVGGTLSASSVPSSSGTLTLSGVTGDVMQWEESDDGLRWYALANTTMTQDYAGLRASTQFRARVRNADCNDAVSDTVTVSP